MPRKIEQFTSSGRKILRLAQSIALRAQHEEIRPHHLLLAMARSPETNAYHALQDVDIVEGKLARFLSVRYPARTGHPLHFEGVAYGDAVQNLFKLSLLDARLRGDDYIASANLLIGFARLNHTDVKVILDHFSLEPKALIKAAEYYIEHPVEPRRYRIPVSGAAGEPQGCLELLQRIVQQMTRKRLDDE